jgi:hypothetical protein
MLVGVSSASSATQTYFDVAVRRIREANGDDAGPLFGEAA